MAFIQKKPQVGVGTQFYTLGLNKTLLIVGLGNIGREYDGTRHNIGFAVVDAFAQANDFPAWIDKKDLKCHLTQATLGSTRVLLVKPTTFMNLSGEAVQAVMHFYKLSTDQIVAVHDEIDIPFGHIRTRIGGSSAGHNGIKSITQHLGEEYGRVRIGIGPKEPAQMDTSDFVLARFSSGQAADLPKLLREACAILSERAYGDELLPETRSFLM